MRLLPCFGSLLLLLGLALVGCGTDKPPSTSQPAAVAVTPTALPLAVHSPTKVELGQAKEARHEQAEVAKVEAIAIAKEREHEAQKEIEATYRDAASKNAAALGAPIGILSDCTKDPQIDDAEWTTKFSATLAELDRVAREGRALVPSKRMRGVQISYNKAMDCYITVAKFMPKALARRDTDAIRGCLIIFNKAEGYLADTKRQLDAVPGD